MKLNESFVLTWLAFGLLAAGPMEPGRADTAFSEGITEPVVDVMLSFPEPGIVTVKKFGEGDFVHTNDVILELDSRLEQLEVERRRFVMENRKADWESTLAVSRRSGSVSHDELLKREVEYNVAVREYEAALEQLHRRTLAVPASGVLTEIKLHVGEACLAYQPVARLVDTRRCYFISNVEAGKSAHLKTGQGVQLEIEDAGGPIKLEGKLVFVSPVVDPASGLQRVKAVFDNADGRVRPGLTGRMRFE